MTVPALTLALLFDALFTPIDGPPGTGKTLTAEAVAEVLRRPLYTISMGELGTTPVELESGLKGVFDMVERWKGIVLLDEADIFVERRTASAGVVRNSMVGRPWVVCVCVCVRARAHPRGSSGNR